MKPKYKLSDLVKYNHIYDPKKVKLVDQDRAKELVRMYNPYFDTFSDLIHECVGKYPEETVTLQDIKDLIKRDRKRQEEYKDFEPLIVPNDDETFFALNDYEVLIDID